MKIAIIGSGVSGLATAWYLAGSGHQVTVFEKESSFGGHATGLDVDYQQGSNTITVPVNPAFDLFSKASYTHYFSLLEALGQEYQQLPFSYTYQCVNSAHQQVQWVAMMPLLHQWRNLLQLTNLHYRRLLWASFKLGYKAMAFVKNPRHGLSYADFLVASNMPQDLIASFFIPAFARLWGMKPVDMQEMPAEIIVEWLVMHRSLRPNPVPWYCVKGGTHQYILKLVDELTRRGVQLLNNVEITSVLRHNNKVQLSRRDGIVEEFDHVVMATNAIAALKMLHSPTAQESNLLNKFCYQANQVVVHTDERLMPADKMKWSYFNVCYNAQTDETYNSIWFGQTQNVPVFATNYRELPFKPSADKVYAQYTFQQPVFDGETLQARKELESIQGNRHTWFCGVYTTGGGHHEDGVASAIKVAQCLAALAS